MSCDIASAVEVRPLFMLPLLARPCFNLLCTSFLFFLEPARWTSWTWAKQDLELSLGDTDRLSCFFTPPRCMHACMHTSGFELCPPVELYLSIARLTLSFARQTWSVACLHDVERDVFVYCPLSCCRRFHCRLSCCKHTLPLFMKPKFNALSLFPW